ncbi:hypothetical protein BEN48_16860 [Hymenobacter glacialis]|uniref:Uncharacterized protein n=1 Tax=Hymenobacter glacialis TaxID=1908236 RepID=A0A1G1SYG6_9BACT|nr:hypothetical protein BEN48_16860 [Hymenobacter glacialis]
MGAHTRPQGALGLAQVGGDVVFVLLEGHGKLGVAEEYGGQLQAQQQRRRVYPVAAAGPAGHVRRLKQGLAQRFLETQQRPVVVNLHV